MVTVNPNRGCVMGLMTVETTQTNKTAVSKAEIYSLPISFHQIKSKHFYIAQLKTTIAIKVLHKLGANKNRHIYQQQNNSNTRKT